VTHDQVEALTMCDRIAVMNHGRLEQLGSPEDLYERPASAFVASFVGRTNQLRGVARGDIVEAQGLTLRTTGRHRGDVVVMVRPHRITIGDRAGSADGEVVNTLTGRVIRTVYAGDMTQTDVNVAGAVISAERSNTGNETAPAADTLVTLSFLARDTLVYPASSS